MNLAFCTCRQKMNDNLRCNLHRLSEAGMHELLRNLSTNLNATANAISTPDVHTANPSNLVVLLQVSAEVDDSVIVIDDSFTDNSENSPQPASHRANQLEIPNTQAIQPYAQARQVAVQLRNPNVPAMQHNIQARQLNVQARQPNTQARQVTVQLRNPNVPTIQHNIQARQLNVQARQPNTQARPSNIQERHPLVDVQRIRTPCPTRGPLPNVQEELLDDSLNVTWELQKPLGCPVCYGQLKNKSPFSTICGHLFCQKCLRKVMTSSRKCPLCIRPLAWSEIHPVYL